MLRSPAWAGAGPTSSLGTLQALGDLAGLLQVFVGGSPEKETSRYTPDGYRNFDFGGHAEDAGFHGGKASSFGKGHAGSVLGERLDFAFDGLVELGIHPRATAHAAGFVQGDVFECKGRWLLRHGMSLSSSEEEKSMVSPSASGSTHASRRRT